MLQGLVEPGQYIGRHFVAVAFIEQFVPRLRVDIELQALAAGLAQSTGQILQTYAIAHRITFSAQYQQWQARIDLGQVEALLICCRPPSRSIHS